MSADGHGTKRDRNIVENYNRLSRVDKRYRQTTDRRQTDGPQHIANMNVSSRSLKLLGINLNSDFSWKSHVEAITSKATQRIYFVRRAGVPQSNLLHTLG